MRWTKVLKSHSAFCKGFFGNGRGGKAVFVSKDQLEVSCVCPLFGCLTYSDLSSSCQKPKELKIWPVSCRPSNFNGVSLFFSAARRIRISSFELPSSLPLQTLSLAALLLRSSGHREAKKDKHKMSAKGLISNFAPWRHPRGERKRMLFFVALRLGGGMLIPFLFVPLMCFGNNLMSFTFNYLMLIGLSKKTKEKDVGLYEFICVVCPVWAKHHPPPSAPPSFLLRSWRLWAPPHWVCPHKCPSLDGFCRLSACLGFLSDLVFLFVLFWGGRLKII